MQSTKSLMILQSTHRRKAKHQGGNNSLSVFRWQWRILGTGYELGLLFLESQKNRQTIQFYTTLAKTLVENGNYDAAEVYLIEAEEIDASNADVVSTKAFIDMMELIKASVKTNSQELANAIFQVAGGKKYLSPEITGVVIDDFLLGASSEKTATPTSLLSAREREVLQLIAEGWSTKQIASHLYVSIKTIETHRRQIMKKLDLHNIAELTKYAIREGLTSIE